MLREEGLSRAKRWLIRRRRRRAPAAGPFQALDSDFRHRRRRAPAAAPFQAQDPPLLDRLAPTLSANSFPGSPDVPRPTRKPPVGPLMVAARHHEGGSGQYF
ncbi:hypothetical protein U1Q18_035656 [Sarracenia purpurea var. burkii]